MSLYSYDSFGNVLTETHSGRTDIKGDELAVVRTFLNETSDNKWQIGLLESSTVTKNGRSIDYDFTYDEFGRPTQKTVMASGVEGLNVTDFGYDTYGNVATISTTNPNNSDSMWEMSIEYDNIAHQFPIKITGLQNRFLKFEYQGIHGDKGLFGQVSRTYGLGSEKYSSGLINDYEYDTFGRLVSMQANDIYGI